MTSLLYVGRGRRRYSTPERFGIAVGRATRHHVHIRDALTRKTVYSCFAGAAYLAPTRPAISRTVSSVPSLQSPPDSSASGLPSSTTNLPSTLTTSRRFLPAPYNARP